MPAPLAVVSTPRMLASASLALIHGVLTLAYAFPELARGTAPATGGNRVSIVSYLDSLGPIWQTIFGLTGAGILLGLAFPRRLALAHQLGGAAVAVFCTALWFGFAVSDPRPSILSALAYTGLMIFHITLGSTYARMTSLALAPRPRATDDTRASGLPQPVPTDRIPADDFPTQEPVHSPLRALPPRRSRKAGGRHTLREAP